MKKTKPAFSGFSISVITLTPEKEAILQRLKDLKGEINDKLTHLIEEVKYSNMK